MKRKTIVLLFCLAMLLSLNQVVFAEEVRVGYFDLEQPTPYFDAENVPVDQTIVLRFTREVKRLNGVIKLVAYTKGEVPTIEEVSGNIITLKPLSNLDYNTRYYIELQPNSVENGEDRAPNYFKGRTHIINFTTVKLNAQTPLGTQTIATTTQQPVTLQFMTEDKLQTVQTYTIKKNLPVIYKLNMPNATYKLWTSNPQLINVQVQGDTLIVNGLNTGTAQVAVRNLVDNTKVVFNVVVQ